MRIASTLLAALLAAGLAAAQEPDASSDADIARRAHGFSQQVMSPYCPGRTLADCPSPDALAVRQQVRDLIAAGVPEDAIRERLSTIYGDAIEGTPRSAWGWWTPIVALLLGGAVLVYVLRRQLSGGAGPAGEEPPSDIERELDAELSDRGL